MNTTEWIALAKANQEKLLDLISAYHPASYEDESSIDILSDLPITAPNAEAACGVVRRKIREETKRDPVEQFKGAIENEDVDTIMSLLNGAWFGVPESTICWSIEGFKEAVELLEDPPEDMN